MFQRVQSVARCWSVTTRRLQLLSTGQVYQLEQNEHLLKSVEEKLKPLSAILAIKELSEDTTKEDAQNALKLVLKKDPKADQKLVQIIKTLEDEKVGSLRTKSLVNTIKILQILGVPPETFCLQNLENALTWQARTCTIRDLSMLLSFSSARRSQSSTIEKLYREVVQTLERRWVEIEDAQTIIGIIHYSEAFHTTFRAKIEDRTIELAEKFSPREIAMILKEMGSQKRRTVPVLRALGYHLIKSKDELDLKSISDVLFALNKLAFRDVELMEGLCDRATSALLLSTSEVDYAPTSVIRSMLTSLGQSRLRHTPLLDQITTWLTNNEDKLESKDLLAFLLTTASLNYVSPGSEHLLTVVQDQLTQSALESEASKSDIMWLDVVWSLAVLNMATPAHFESVLSTDFYNQILYAHDHRNVRAILKLLNVNAAAQFLLTGGYNGPIINVDGDPLLRDVGSSSPRSVDRTKLLDTVFDSFYALASPPDYLLQHVNTTMGFSVDAEAVFEHGKPLSPIQDFSCLSSSMPKAKLPRDAKRVAIKVLSYNDCLLSSSELSGLNKLCKTLLEARGYSVLFIRHDDLKAHHQKVEKIKMLEAKLKTLLSST